MITASVMEELNSELYPRDLFVRFRCFCVMYYYQFGDAFLISSIKTNLNFTGDQRIEFVKMMVLV